MQIEELSQIYSLIRKFHAKRTKYSTKVIKTLTKLNSTLQPCPCPCRTYKLVLQIIWISFDHCFFFSWVSGFHKGCSNDRYANMSNSPFDEISPIGVASPGTI